MLKHIPALVLNMVTAATLAGCAAPLAQIDACLSPLTPALLNSCVVTKNILWRGGKPDALGAAELISLGVKTVVNLELMHDDRDTFKSVMLTPENREHIVYFRVRDWEPNVVFAPAMLDAHIAEFLAIVRSQPKPIYVHCRSGQNRTGIMVAAYRIFEEGVSVENAINEMQKYQGVWFELNATYLRKLSSTRRAEIESRIKELIPKLREEVIVL